ncbi:hypothetical protein DFP72DRAFT_839587 [Ephemerocybe angulata]|uniref:Uncharacterized protein n=1 Tax=Ephemerocybe angulata TaxID=980116 RepID=A0A8H6IKN9_9AGAR|nr:hypothetical protein DFP72DRAFT_839587 [Tulosesus angulatus]
MSQSGIPATSRCRYPMRLMIPLLERQPVFLRRRVNKTVVAEPSAGDWSEEEVVEPSSPRPETPWRIVQFAEDRDTEKKTASTSAGSKRIASSSTSVINGARVIKPLPKRIGQRQSARITDRVEAELITATCTITASSSTVEVELGGPSVEGRMRYLRESTHCRLIDGARRKVYCTLCECEVHLKAKKEMCVEKWIDHVMSSGHGRRMVAEWEKEEGNIVRMSIGKGKGKALGLVFGFDIVFSSALTTGFSQSVSRVAS